MPRLLYLVAVSAGVFSTALPGSNAKLSKGLAQPTSGSIVEGVVVVLLGLIGLTYGGMQWPRGAQLAKIPGWLWIGGFVARPSCSQSTIAQRIGAAPDLALTVMVGWPGLIRNPASCWPFDRQRLDDHRRRFGRKKPIMRRDQHHWSNKPGQERHGTIARAIDQRAPLNSLRHAAFVHRSM